MKQLDNDSFIKVKNWTKRRIIVGDIQPFPKGWNLKEKLFFAGIANWEIYNTYIKVPPLTLKEVMGLKEQDILDDEGYMYQFEIKRKQKAMKDVHDYLHILNPATVKVPPDEKERLLNMDLPKNDPYTAYKILIFQFEAGILKDLVLQDNIGLRDIEPLLSLDNVDKDTLPYKYHDAVELLIPEY